MGLRRRGEFSKFDFLKDNSMFYVFTLHTKKKYDDFAKGYFERRLIVILYIYVEIARAI